MSKIKIKVDSLGRIVIPIKIRKKLGIELNSEIYMMLDDDRATITSTRDKCVICSGKNEVIGELNMCMRCVNKILDFSKNITK